MPKEQLLTTVDNPWNPFTDFDAWFAYDHMMGYDTCNYLARVSNTSDSMGELDEKEAINEAMNEIVRINPLGIYTIITQDEPKETEEQDE